MKKILLVLLSCLLLTGCGNTVSQEEYDAVVAENKEIESKTTEKYVETKTEFEEVQEVKDTTETIDSFEWKYDENNYFSVYIQKNLETEKLSTIMIGYYDENNKGLMQIDFAYYQCSFVPRGIDANSFFTVGEETYMWIMSKGNVVPGSMELEEDISYPKEYEEKSRNMAEEMSEFCEKNFGDGEEVSEEYQKKEKSYRKN